jgi:hypothetical protein
LKLQTDMPESLVSNVSRAEASSTIGDTRFAKQLEHLHQLVQSDEKSQLLLRTGPQGPAQVISDFAAGRRNDGSYRLRHFYWCGLDTTGSHIAARTLTYHRRDDAVRWSDFPDDTDLPTISAVLQAYPAITFLRYIPLRRLTYVSQLEAGRLCVVKIKRADRSKDAAMRLRQIGRLSTQQDARFLVPELIHHDGSLRCLTQSFAEGELLKTSAFNRQGEDLKLPVGFNRQSPRMSSWADPVTFSKSRTPLNTLNLNEKMVDYPEIETVTPTL